jgi:hypothetical protein
MSFTIPGGGNAANIDAKRSTLLDVYAALVSAMCTGCVPPPRVVLRASGDQRTVELEFPQSYVGARAAVDSWATEFGAAAQETAGILSVRYSFEPHHCRRVFAAGWGLRVVAHLDLPRGRGLAGSHPRHRTSDGGQW